MSDESQYQTPYSQNPATPPAAGAQGSSTTPNHRLADATAIERMVRAQVAARTQAQAATTVVLATIVSLITSAFSFVAALAWNSAIQQLLKENVNIHQEIFGLRISEGGVQAIYALIVTFIAVVVVVILNRIARRYATKSALGTN